MDCPSLSPDIALLFEAEMWELWLIDRARGPTDAMHALFSPDHEVEVLQRILPSTIAVLPTASLPADSSLPSINYPQTPSAQLLYLFLGPLGGHYASVFYEAQGIILYDSMVRSDELGAFTHYFVAYLRHRYPSVSLRIETPLSGEACLQPTGGFLSIQPVGSNGSDLIRLCHPQNQDHFCWSWGFLSLQLHASGRSLSPIRRFLATNHLSALALVKTYTWWLAEDCGFHLPVEYHRDFLSIWDAEDRNDPSNYRRYLLEIGPRPNDLNDVIGHVRTHRQEHKELVPIRCE